MFAYCGNNPVNRSDRSGMLWQEIGKFFVDVWNGLKTLAGNVFGAQSSVTHTQDSPTFDTGISPVSITAGNRSTIIYETIGDDSAPISVYSAADTNFVHSSIGVKLNKGNRSFIWNGSVSHTSAGVAYMLHGTEYRIEVVGSLRTWEIGVEFSTTQIIWDETFQIESTNYFNIGGNAAVIVGLYQLVTSGSWPQYSYQHAR